MILSMRSLFLKIFLWFWITVIATGVALVATWIILQPKNVQSQIQTTAGGCCVGVRDRRCR